MVCARCGAEQNVKLEDARTAYYFEGKIGSDDDPNRPIPLCPECAAEYHQHWDYMWAEYHSGIL